MNWIKDKLGKPLIPSFIIPQPPSAQKTEALRRIYQQNEHLPMYLRGPNRKLIVKCLYAFTTLGFMGVVMNVGHLYNGTHKIEPKK